MNFPATLLVKVEEPPVSEPLDRPLTYGVDNPTKPSRITSIRGVTLPDGVLHTYVNLADASRILTEDAIEDVLAAYYWTDAMSEEHL